MWFVKMVCLYGNITYQNIYIYIFLVHAVVILNLHNILKMIIKKLQLYLINSILSCQMIIANNIKKLQQAYKNCDVA